MSFSDVNNNQNRKSNLQKCTKELFSCTCQCGNVRNKFSMFIKVEALSNKP